ncbi:MAG: lysylphosphatidylglycerol synthase transmembrane domain-containing protein [Prevotella sp.]|jgi:uncharacterized membrane protein YbhN (UPF0104 family)
MRRIFNNILFVVGCVAVVVMVLAFDVNISQLWSYLTQASWWLLAIFVLWIVVYCMNTLAWSTIISGSGPRNISLWHLLQLTVSGYALNSATSIGLVSGEPYRVVELSRYIGTQRATSSVVLFVMTHTYSHFWFWLTAVVAYLLSWSVGWVEMTTPIAWGLGFATLLSCGGIWLFLAGYKHGMVVWLLRGVGHIPGLKRWSRKMLAEHGEGLQHIDELIAQLRGQRRSSFLKSLGLEYSARLLQCLEVFAILVIFHADAGFSPITLLHAFFILAFTSLFANMLGFIPMQIGGREGGFAMSVAGLGMSASTGLGISIICRVRELLFDVIGMIWMKLSDWIWKQQKE